VTPEKIEYNLQIRSGDALLLMAGIQAFRTGSEQGRGARSGSHGKASVHVFTNRTSSTAGSGSSTYSSSPATLE